MTFENMKYAEDTKLLPNTLFDIEYERYVEHSRRYGTLVYSRDEFDLAEWLHSPARFDVYKSAPSAETSPSQNPKDIAGARKCRLDTIPWGAVAQTAPVFAHGAEKYGAFNWRDTAIGRKAYLAAAMRHIMADLDGETQDPESGQAHIAHAVAGLLILLDASSLGMCKDDRPKPGMAAEIIALQTRKH